jgi:N-terminal acetyltransferase B complex non-catalytic subunit
MPPLLLPQIQSDLGAPSFSTPAAAAQHAQQLLQLYAAALPLYQGLDERERGPADELLWQAAAALVAAAGLQQHTPGTTTTSSSSSSASIGYLLQAVLVLEAAVKGRPYCAPVRLGLTGLYGLLGNAAGAALHFGGLDVKHVQHDTLSSHHLLPLLLGLKAGVQTEGLLGSMCALFEDHLEDAGDTLMQAYKNGTHTKASGGFEI